MATPEDVQYFQFDSDGNMYIYEPGAGCSGIPRRVEPGEELHLFTERSFSQEKELWHTSYVPTVSDEYLSQPSPLRDMRCDTSRFILFNYNHTADTKIDSDYFSVVYI